MTIPANAVLLRSSWQQRTSLEDDQWPTAEWSEVCSAGVTRWTLPVEFGGEEFSAEDLVEGCLELTRGQLLTTFVLSQFQAACQRLVVANCSALKERWLPGLAAGRMYATVGISHLTTSRQHTIPAVTATPEGTGYRLSGEIPWVTGCRHAAVIVVGGTLADGRQILAAVPTDRPGVLVGEPMRLLALTGSETGPVTLRDVIVHIDELIAGPIERVVQQSSTGGAGSLMTSTLAVGHAYGCLDRLQQEAAQRRNLEPVVAALFHEADNVRQDLLAAATKQTVNVATPEELRTRATDLALRSSQAFLTATKGAGFLVGHPAERLAREAMFFLVWSCPQVVANQLLQGFGGCDSGV